MESERTLLVGSTQVNQLFWHRFATKAADKRSTGVDAVVHIQRVAIAVHAEL